LAIAGIPSNFIAQQANAQVSLTWDRSVGALSYVLQRSIDATTYSTIASPTANSYLDDTVAIGTEYFYRVAAVNGSGTSSYSSIQSAIPAPTSELSLKELRTRAQQKADQVNSQFVTTSEWNFFINQSMTELYDLILTSYEDYFLSEPVSFTTNGTDNRYPLPNGVLSFTDANGSSVVAKPFYKLFGVDLALNTAQNAFVTINKFNFIDRNKFVYPNTASTLYGVFNMRYRVMGNKIEFTPTPSANQTIRLWYTEKLQSLLQDTDITTIGYSGWLQYVIVRAAKYAMDKEESSSEKLDAELLFLKSRIEAAAQNRDEGQPNTISDIRSNNNWGFGGSGFNGPTGGM
jgi:hypothetical protein